MKDFIEIRAVIDTGKTKKVKIPKEFADLNNLKEGQLISEPYEMADIAVELTDWMAKRIIMRCEARRNQN